ncbi:Thioredoxin-disulfide reductase [Candidatus Hepatincolaceae symbiont of Richtersius coronifer]
MQYKVKESSDYRDLIIIGSGPAGYSAAIYAKRSGIDVVMITGLEQGGQLMGTTNVDNYPGFTHILGPQLMANMEEQTRALEVEIINDYINSVDLGNKIIKLNGNQALYSAKSIIIATGSGAKWLGAKGEAKYRGYGVSSCATCDGFFFKNQVVAVVGGGNVAIEDALYLSNVAKKVYIIHRRNEFRGEKILQNKLVKNYKIEIIWDHTVDEILGEENPLSVKEVRIKNVHSGITKNLQIDGLFVAIGHTPNTSFLKGVVDLDEDQYIKTYNNTCQILVNGKVHPGVFAAGDVRDKIYRQAITSAATGCQAALDVQSYLGHNF